MNLTSIKTAVPFALSRSGLILKKYSPEILTVVGVVGVVASAVLASKATLNLEPIVDRFTEDVQTAKDFKADGLDGTYSDRDYSKAITSAYTQGAIGLVKLYGPSVTFGVASIACILGGHNITRKRNVGMIAAYKTLEQGFAEYRKRVVEELGLDKDAEFYHGVRTESVVDPVTGETTLQTVVDPNSSATYAKIFDDQNRQWSPVEVYNTNFLKNQQNYANDLLRSRGHLFLNEVYKELGFEHTSAGAVVGWLWNKDGDNFVDFGMFDLDNIKRGARVDGVEGHIYLDFNVDGLIYDKI